MTKYIITCVAIVQNPRYKHLAKLLLSPVSLEQNTHILMFERLSCRLAHARTVFFYMYIGQLAVALFVADGAGSFRQVK